MGPFTFGQVDGLVRHFEFKCGCTIVMIKINGFIINIRVTRLIFVQKYFFNRFGFSFTRFLRRNTNVVH